MSKLLQRSLLLPLFALLGGLGIVSAPLAESAVVPVGLDAVDAVFHPSGTVSYVLNSGDSTITVVDTASHGVMNVISLGQPVGTCRDLDWHDPTGRLLVGTTGGLVLEVDPVAATVLTIINTPGASYSVISADNFVPGTTGWGIDANTGWLHMFLGGVAAPTVLLPIAGATEMVEKRRDASSPPVYDPKLYILASTTTNAVLLAFDRLTMMTAGPITVPAPAAVPAGLSTSTGSEAYVAVNAQGLGRLFQVNLATFTFVTPALASWATVAYDVSVAGQFVVVLAQTSGGVGTDLRVYDAGDPAQVLYAGRLPANASLNPRAGLAVTLLGGATIDDLHAVNPSQGVGATSTSMGESRETFVNATPPTVLEVEAEITSVGVAGIPDQEARPCSDCPEPGLSSAGAVAGDGYAQPATASAASVMYATGEEVYRLPLVSVPSPGIRTEIDLTYRSRRHYDYRYGNGWFLNQDARLVPQPSGDVRSYDGRGRRDTYTVAAGGYQAPLHFDTLLASTGGGAYSLTNRRGDTATYAGLYGTRAAYTDRYANQVQFQWSGTQLTGMTDTLGRQYTFAYDAQGRMSSSTDFSGRTWTFSYDYLGQLRQVTRPASTQFPQGRSTWFSYSGNSADPRLKSNLVHVWNGRGEKAQTLTYDANDLVIGEQLGEGTYAIAYDGTAGTRTVEDRAVNTTKFTFDSNALVTRTERFTKGLRAGEPTSYVTQYRIGSNGYPENVVLPRGNRIDYVYDANLDLTEVRRRVTDTSTNAASDLVTTYAYGVFSQLASATDAKGNTTTYTLDGLGNTTQIQRATVTQPVTQTSIVGLSHDARGRITSTTDPEGRVTELAYYTSGPMVGGLKEVREDPQGLNRVTTFEYDTRGNVTALVDPSGARTTMTVDTEGYVTAAVLPSPYNFQAKFTYDQDRNVTKVERQNLDRHGVPDATTPWIDTTATFDALGRVVTTTARLTSALTATTSYQYDGAGQLTEVVSPEGNATRIAYDERQLVFQVTRGFGSSQAATSQFDYDANGSLVQAIDPRGGVVTYRYDAFDRNDRVTNELGHYVAIERDALGLPTLVEAHAQGGLLVAGSTNHYDEVGRLWKRVTQRFGPGISPSTPTTIVTRDRADRVVSVQDALGRTTSRSYDALGRVAAIGDAVGNQLAYEYDARGQVTRVLRTEVPAGGGAAEVFATEFAYDELGRLRTRREVDRTNATNVLVTSSDYDSRGNLTFSVDAEGHPTRWTYDLANRLLSRERALSTGSSIEDFVTAITETFAYDRDGRLTQLRDDNYRTTTYGFDALDRVTTTTTADTRSTSSTFDLNGNLHTWTDPNGTVVTNTYDARNRLVARAIARGSGVQGTTAEAYSYDALDRLLIAVDDDTRVEHTYDSLGNLLSERQGYNVTGQERWMTMATSYDDVGAVTGQVYPSAFAVGHTRDVIDRLTALVDVGASATIASLTYQGIGRRQATTNQNGTVTEYAYDGFARVATIDHLLAGGGSLHKMEYLYDRVHNRRMEKHTFHAAWVATLPGNVQAFLNGRQGKGDVYAYDWAYRLVDARYDVANPAAEVATPASQAYGRLVQYTLDGLGNRSQVTTTVPPGGPATTTYATDVVNQYTAVGGVSRAHDLNGSLTDDGTHLLRTDYRNHVTEVLDKATQATIATYRYDALGRRTEKVVAGGATTRYLLDGLQVVEEVSGTDVWQARYVYEDRIDQPRVMDRADQADVDQDGNTTEVLRFAYHQNALGSVTELTAPSGAVIEWVTYDVYGSATVRDRVGTVGTQSAVGNPYLYTGREWDPERSTYFYRARDYDPTTGRFQQRDPLGYVDGLSLYEFVSSAPSVWVDPMGTDHTKDAAQRYRNAKVALKTRIAEAAAAGAEARNTRAANAKRIAELEAEIAALQDDMRRREKKCRERGRGVNAPDIAAALGQLLSEMERLREDSSAAQAASEAADAAVNAARQEVAAALAALRGGSPSRQDILDLVRDDIVDFGEEWAREAMKVPSFRAVPADTLPMFPDDDGVYRQAVGTQSGDLIRISNDEIDEAWNNWMEWGESDLAAVVVHEARHWVIEREGKDLWAGSPPSNQALRDHPPCPPLGPTQAGYRGWRVADDKQGMTVDRLAREARGQR